jgi:hypothetical protein
MEWVYLQAFVHEGASVGCDFCSGEALVQEGDFLDLGNAVKNYVLIS